MASRWHGRTPASGLLWMSAGACVRARLQLHARDRQCAGAAWGAACSWGFIIVSARSLFTPLPTPALCCSACAPSFACQAQPLRHLNSRPHVAPGREAAQLLAAAVELGYDAAAVEAQLQEHRGDWHAAGDALRRLARGQEGAASSAADWPATDEGWASSGQADAGGWQDSEAGAMAADAAAYFPGALPSTAGASSGSDDIWAQLIAAAKGWTPVLPGSSQGGGSGRGSSLGAAPPDTPELENFGPHTITGNATSPGETEQLGALSPPPVSPYCVAPAASAPASRPGSAPPAPTAATAEYSEGYQAGVSAMMAHLGLAPATPAAGAAPAADVDWGALLGGGGSGGAAAVWGGPAAGAPAGAPANTWQQEGVQGAMPSQQPLEEELQDMLAMLCGGE